MGNKVKRCYWIIPKVQYYIDAFYYLQKYKCEVQAALAKQLLQVVFLISCKTMCSTDLATNQQENISFDALKDDLMMWTPYFLQQN
jgi:hypothetical protein